MSLSSRVNVFLERARQFSSISPVKSASLYEKDLGRQHQERTMSSEIGMRHSLKSVTRQESDKKHMLGELEIMIEDFFKSRYDVSKKLQTFKHKELKIITDLKKTLDIELEKNKIDDMHTFENLCREKTEKFIQIVKEEAIAMDKKLLDLAKENSKLKQILSEKNIELIDKKNHDSKGNLNSALSRLSNLKNIPKKSCSQLSGLFRITTPDQIPEIIDKIIYKNEEEILCMLTQEIIEKVEESKKNIQSLSISLQKKREYSTALSQKIEDIKNKISISKINHRGSIKDFPKPKELMIYEENLIESIKYPNREFKNPTFGSINDCNYMIGSRDKNDYQVKGLYDKERKKSGEIKSEEVKVGILVDDDELFMADKDNDIGKCADDLTGLSFTAKEILDEVYDQILAEWE